MLIHLNFVSEIKWISIKQLSYMFVTPYIIFTCSSKVIVDNLYQFVISFIYQDFTQILSIPILAWFGNNI